MHVQFVQAEGPSFHGKIGPSAEFMRSKGQKPSSPTRRRAPETARPVLQYGRRIGLARRVASRQRCLGAAFNYEDVLSGLGESGCNRETGNPSADNADL